VLIIFEQYINAIIRSIKNHAIRGFISYKFCCNYHQYEALSEVHCDEKAQAKQQQYVAYCNAAKPQILLSRMHIISKLCNDNSKALNDHVAQLVYRNRSPYTAAYQWL